MKLKFLVLAAALPWLVIATSHAAGSTEAEKQGRELVAGLLSEASGAELSKDCVLRIRDRDRHVTEIPFRLRIVATPTNRNVIVEPSKLTTATQMRQLTNGLDSARSTTPIAGSDFWLEDLSLEFLRWPEQRVLKSEMRRGRSCKLLESVNPHPEPGGYGRVLSWIDNDSDGIVMAEAYDALGKLLKEFVPRDFKKVNGRWEVKQFRIRNAQTGSQTTIDFDLEGQE